MLLYGLSCCCISFVLSTLIKKSKTANTIGVMIIVAFFAIYFVNRGLERKPKAHLICTFTISPISFLSIFNYLIQLEKQKLTVTFLNMLKNKLLRNYFLGLVTSLIAYFIIAIYLDNVLPQGNNFHRKWHFIITDLFRRNKKKKISTTDPDSNSSSPFIQKDPEGLSKAVEIKNVGKSFKVKRENIEILKNIDFNAYYDEIFAILGHNGAGKTTLISIMTGILSASHGEVYYDDVPITDNETEICRQFGYCPQFDTFNNSLTLAEHVRLFAGIKNVNVNIDEILRDIDLLDKKDNYPKQLSGGQRRKLCITLALLGSPKYVFLDEPTTGLDPYSRKNIWELLSQKKKGRVMFVTTHYMDEADLLADRKMIISNGNISCLGTSLFLKNRFNMNYSLDIHVEDPKDCLLIDEFIEKCCPGSLQNKGISNTNIHVHLENDSNHSNAELKEDYLVTYLLPMKYSESFKTIFERLNYLIKDGRNSIKNFSLTAPTLEELFIKLESNTNETGDESQKGKGFAAVDMDKDSSKLIDQLNPVFGKTNFNHSSSLQQILSIMKLRFKIFIRNKTFALLYTLIPVCLIILCIYFENMIIKQMDEPVQFKALDIQPSIYEDVQWFKDSTSTGQAAEIVNKIGAHSKISIQSLNYEKELSFSSNKLRGDMKYIGGFDGKDVQQTPEFLIYTNMTYNYAIPIAINLLSNAVLEQNQINRQISVTYKPLDYYPNQLYTENDENNQFNIMPELAKLILEPILIVAMAIAISLSISIFGPLTVKEREEGITHQLFLNGTKRINYWIGVLLSDAICILVPMMFIAITGIFNEISIFKTKVIGYTVIISITWALASLLHQYIASYFYKKYEKVSTLFIIVNPILSLLIGIYAIVIAVISSIDVNALVKDDKEVTDEVRKDGNFWQYKYYLVLVLFAPATIVLLYTKLTSYILIRKISITKEDILSFMLTEALDTMKRDDLSNKEKSKLLAKKFFDKKIPSFSELMKERGTNNFVILIAGMIVLILFYMIILYLFEKSKSRVLKKNTNYTPAERQILDKKLETGPKDVLNEWKRVGYSLNGDNNLSKKIALKVYQLNKDFKINMNEVRKKRKENANANANNNGDYNNNNGKKSAFQKMDNRIIYDKKKNKHINRIVDDVTFGVDVGECLGLLGPNGAGKTTSISMITGLLSHTHGTVVYGDKDISQTDMPDLSLGYCSQHDSLWKLLTVKETIQFYLNICGYPRKDIPRYTKALAEACGIEIHLNKKVSEISGGTKRKLSLIVAICSSPNYLILDEPSAGMDPFTRRYMWKLISELKKVRETATILTTHSTEEAEALCDRIAILIKGRLVCVDSPKSIKMNHSHSYILEVFTDRPEEFEEVYVRGQNIFGLASNENYQLESSISYQKYSVQMKTENIANVFSVMEQAKKAGIISQYNFGQYSLEQVFINFVNNVE
jgi:ABC-type multidrug transport system ATPase subunit